MPAFSPTIGKFGDVTARGNPWMLWYKRNKVKLLPYIGGVIGLLLIAGGWWLWQGQMIPAPGGTLDEGLIGQPQRLNPLYSSLNDVDAEITPLVFRSLLKYDEEFSLINDLAKSVTKNDDGTAYEIVLGDHQWQDGAPITSKDVAFTIRATQDAEYAGPWADSFTGVSISIKDESTLTLNLEDSHAPFEHNLTLGLLPEHLLAGMTAKQLAADDFNRAPIGSGKLQYTSHELRADGEALSSMTFALSDGYIDEIKFHFYPSYGEAITDFKLGKLDTLGAQYTDQLADLSGFDHGELSTRLTGQSYGLYFNLTKESVSDAEARRTLARSLDKQKLIDTVFLSHASIMDNVYYKGHWAYSESHDPIKPDLSGAKESWSDLKNQPQELSLLVSDRPTQTALANEVANTWSELGIKVTVNTVASSEIGQVVQSADNYDVVLLGEKMRPDPDRYTNWHSTQTPENFGLNVSRLENDRVDKALEDALTLLDRDERKTKYATFQDYLSREQPVIWLYQPHYIYMWGSKVNGVKIPSMWEESDRFATISSWYVNQQRRSN